MSEVTREERAAMTDRDLLASSRPAMAAYPHDQTDKVRAALEGSGRAPPIRGADPVGQFRGRVAEIQSNSTDLELVVFPETHLCGDCDKAVDANDRLRSAVRTARRAPGCGHWGRRRGARDVADTRIVPELGDGGRVYNTQVVFDPTGNLVAS